VVVVVAARFLEHRVEAFRDNLGAAGGVIFAASASAPALASPPIVVAAAAGRMLAVPRSAEGVPVPGVRETVPRSVLRIVHGSFSVGFVPGAEQSISICYLFPHWNPIRNSHLPRHP